MRKIGVSLVFVALIQILLGLFIVYGSITLYSFSLVFKFVFSADPLLQALTVVLGSLLFGSGLMFLGLSKRFF
jgi:hypothetical protein